VTSPVHDLIPVHPQKDDYDLRLDPGMISVEDIADPLKPVNARPMRSYPVSNRVNQVQNDYADCGAPINLESPPQRQLFA